MSRSEAELAALDYAERGWALVPVRPGTKEPHTDLLPIDRSGKASWKQLALRPASEAEIASWFERDPDTNVAVICGEPSGGLVVLDFDREPAEPVELPPTAAAVTARGRHLYFKAGDRVKTTTHSRGEIKGEGGYVLLPPSRHETGIRYAWEDKRSLADIEIAQLPSELLTNIHPEQVTRYLDTRPDSAKRRSVEDGSKREWLLDFFRDEKVVERAAGVLGIPPGRKLGQSFCCVIPGHSERSPSASLGRNSNDVFIYRDWHRAGGRAVYTLSEVRAAQAYGRTQELAKPSMATWGLRLLVEARVLRPAAVDAPALPSDARYGLRTVYEGFLFLLGVRWLYDEGEPAPYSWRFAGAWSGVSQGTAGQAMQELLKMKLLVKVGEHGRTSLFLPGPGPTPGRKRTV